MKGVGRSGTKELVWLWNSNTRDLVDKIVLYFDHGGRHMNLYMWEHGTETYPHTYRHAHTYTYTV